MENKEMRFERLKNLRYHKDLSIKDRQAIEYAVSFISSNKANPIDALVGQQKIAEIITHLETLAKNYKNLPLSTPYE